MLFQVLEKLQAKLITGFRHSGVNVFDLMKDPYREAQLRQDKEDLANVEKALRELNNI